MKKTFIYGASDDLIEIEGAVSEECNAYHEKPMHIRVSDGTHFSLFYDGQWKAHVFFAGPLYLRTIDSVGDDADHTRDPDAIESTAPGYSDIVVMAPGVEWVKVGRLKFKA